MEVRARYVQMGVFTLAVLAMGFAFVYWLNNAGGLRDRAVYRVQFQGPVSGLLRGSAVLFNGIRVGEVTSLALDPAKPRQVLATISIDRQAPVRKDTEVGIDFQGLTGSPVVTLTGGSSAEPLTVAKGEVPVLTAQAEAGQTMSESARQVLRRLDTVLAENAKPLRDMLDNINTFSAALARNSGSVDGIMAGLARMTGGAAAAARTVTYNLAPLGKVEVKDKVANAQLVVIDPSSMSTLDSEKIATVSADGAIAALPDVQWSDSLARLVQVNIVRSLDDTHAFAGVTRAMEDLTGDFRLVIDVRKFQIAGQTADVELGGKLIDGDGRIIGSQVFAASAPVGAEGAPAAVAALNQAFEKAGPELVQWVVHTAAAHALPKKPEPKKGTEF